MTEVTYRAKWVLPISRPPIENGWVQVVDGQVIAVGRGIPDTRQSVDLGEVALLPALVNAHTHLEFSALTSPIGTPGMRLADWIGQVVAARQQSPIDPAAALLRGLDGIRRSGCALVADIATTPVTYPRQSSFQGRLISFSEVLGLSAERATGKQSLAREHLQAYLNGRLSASDTCEITAGISPHAPYSTPYDLVAWCVAQAQAYRLPLAMHVAESNEERALIEQGEGPFIDSLLRLVPTAREQFPWGPDATLNLIKLLAAAPQCLLVHGNYLHDEEINLLAKHPQMTVVYCPRTHAFFEHAKHPVDRLQLAGVRVALGTDSLASNPDLSIWEEVRWLLRHRQDLSPMDVLKMATLDGAQACGEPRYGQLEPGSHARLLRLNLKGLALAEALATGTPAWVSAGHLLRG